MHTCTYICMNTCRHIYVHTCMYIYVYTYIHAHTCTYIHTHVYTKCQQNVYVHMYLWCHWHSQYISWLKVGVFHLKGTLHTQEYRECEDTHTDTHTHTQRERERERERGSQMGTSVVSIVKSGQATNYHFQLPVAMHVCTSSVVISTHTHHMSNTVR